MSKNKNRRPQTRKPAKSANRDMMMGMQELRKGSRTSPVPSGTDYRRKPKHSKKGWDE